MADFACAVKDRKILQASHLIGILPPLRWNFYFKQYFPRVRSYPKGHGKDLILDGGEQIRSFGGAERKKEVIGDG
ncbi:MAG: hypothetical protein DBX60_05785 [Bacillota bacterium]|nr:MAG: hypothetical protein DBX60_05785 [Bacillota bacterium]